MDSVSIGVGERVNSRNCRDYNRESNLYKEPDEEVLKVFDILKDHDASTKRSPRPLAGVMGSI